MVLQTIHKVGMSLILWLDIFRVKGDKGRDDVEIAAFGVEPNLLLQAIRGSCLLL